MTPTLAQVQPGTVVWAYVRGYWRLATVLEVHPPARVRVRFRIGHGDRTREQEVALEWIRIERPRQGTRVMDLPAPSAA